MDFPEVVQQAQNELVAGSSFVPTFWYYVGRFGVWVVPALLLVLVGSWSPVEWLFDRIDDVWDAWDRKQAREYKARKRIEWNTPETVIVPGVTYIPEPEAGIKPRVKYTSQVMHETASQREARLLIERDDRLLKEWDVEFARWQHIQMQKVGWMRNEDGSLRRYHNATTQTA